MHRWIALCFVTTGFACRSYFTTDNQVIPLGCVSGMFMFSPWEPQVINPRFVVHDRAHVKDPYRVLSWDTGLERNDSLFHAENKLSFIIHGYTESSNEPWIRKMKEAILRKEPNTKVILVDWSRGANHNGTWYYINRYIQASNNALMVARVLACLIERVMATYDVPETSVHIIGHSIGAQVMGRAASWLSERFGIRVGSGIALDAAWPLFSWKGLDPERKDVHFMLAVHTSSTTSFEKLFDGAVGVYEAFAHVNLYPNRGTVIQPACKENNSFFCSHRRGYIYFTDMLLHCNEYCDFKGFTCENEGEAVDGLCSNRTVDVCAYIKGFRARAAVFSNRSTVLAFETDMDQLYMECNYPSKQQYRIV